MPRRANEYRPKANARLERVYQAKLIKRIERLFSDVPCYVRKHDIQQGWPDLIILLPGFWAMLETKREMPTCEEDYEPNQELWIEEFDHMSFSACIYPENEQDVLNALQQAFGTQR